MKKLLCLVLALVLAMSVFVGCGKQEDEKNAGGEPAAEEQVAPEGQTSPEESADPKAPGNPTSVPKSSTADAEQTPDEEAAPNPEQEIPSAATPAPSTNTEVVTEATAPEVYLIVGGDDNAANISYHLKDCSLLSGKEHQVIGWEMVKTLGFRQCPTCNPPRYEGYVE